MPRGEWEREGGEKEEDNDDDEEEEEEEEEDDMRHIGEGGGNEETRTNTTMRKRKRKTTKRRGAMMKIMREAKRTLEKWPSSSCRYWSGAPSMLSCMQRHFPDQGNSVEHRLCNCNAASARHNKTPNVDT